MFLSAISLAIALLGQDPLTPPLSAQVAAAAESATMTISLSNIVLGQGVVIGPGQALTIGDVAFGRDGNPRIGMDAAFGNGFRTKVSVEAYDPVTDLALLKLAQTNELVKPAKLSNANSKGVVLAMLPNRKARAEVTNTSVTGVMSYSRRYVPLIEIRLERGGAPMGGAPVFDATGNLVGLLLASLSTAPQEGASGVALFDSKTFVERAADTVQGPRQAATTFSLALPILNRVVTGFTKNNGVVQHPYLGIFFEMNKARETVITRVVEGGPAAVAGVRAGDVVITAGGSLIENSFDFVAYLFERQVGEMVKLQLRRGATLVEAQVGVVADPSALQQRGTLRRTPAGGQQESPPSRIERIPIGS